MRIVRFFALCSLLCISATSAIAQDREITRDEYFGPWRAALAKARELNRRHISKTEIFNGGKVTATEEWRYEYDVPGKIHYVHVETRGGKTFRVEQIDIGTARYCKRGDKPWELVNSSCIGGGLSGISNLISTRYSVEKTQLDGNNVDLYTQSNIYHDTFSNPPDGLRAVYISKYWLSKDGLVRREEQSDRVLKPESVRRVTIDTYLFDPLIKIEAPIAQP